MISPIGGHHSTALLACSETAGHNDQRVLNGWTEWVHRVQPGQGEYRDRALERLRECLETRNTTLNLEEFGLTDLPDVWPDFIETLNISNNTLTLLPNNLPKSLRNLHASSNQIKQLPQRLPNRLEMLQVNNNKLTVLPDFLPNFLKILNINDNQVQELPGVLPGYLEELYVNNNQLKYLSFTLPYTLVYLSVEGNALTYLPDCLPETLLVLNVGYNELKNCPQRLPRSLSILNINNNQLEDFPETLPDSIQHLNVESNQLDFLPEHLPKSLDSLFAGHNQLTELPTVWPEGLETLHLNNNNIQVLPESFPIYINFNLSHNPVRIIPELFSTIPSSERLEFTSPFMHAVALWINNPDMALWQEIESEDNALMFAYFLEKLQQGMNSVNPELKVRIGNWLHYLTAPENKAMREIVFVVAHEASENCVDRASFYFNKMYCAMIENELIENHATVDVKEMIDTICGLFRLQQLEKIAAKHAEERRKVSPGFDEDIEIYLAYQHKLKEDLELPIYSELQFSDIADISNLDLLRATNVVREQEQYHFLSYLLLESRAWEAIVTAWDSKRVDALNEVYLDEIASEDFENNITVALQKRGVPTSDVDSRRTLSKKMADDLLCKRRFKLLKSYLIEKQALSVISRFDPPKS